MLLNARWRNCHIPFVCLKASFIVSPSQRIVWTILSCLIVKTYSDHSILWCALMAMGTHFHPVKFTSHPVSVHCTMTPQGSTLSHYRSHSTHTLQFPYVHSARMVHCIPSSRHLVPVHSPVVRKYTMFVPKSFVQSDSLSDQSPCEMPNSYPTQIQDRASSANATPVVQHSRTEPAANVTDSVDKNSIESNNSKSDYKSPMCYASKMSNPPLTDGSRGTKRHTDQTLWSPTQKKPRSSDTHLSDVEVSENLESSSKLPLESHKPPLMSLADMKNLSEQILTVCGARQQCKEVYISKMKLRDALYDVIKRLFPYCGLYVIGSSMNGFGNAASDMDLCLMLSHSEIDQKREAMEILQILRKSLQKCNFLRDLRVIHARVPILKFTDKISNLECDLNINNSVGIRNTHLLNAYSCLDCRLAPLVVFVKHWAKIQGINDASQGTVSSYSLVLMIIHFLQFGCSPPVLPSLQQKYPHKFNSTQDVRVLTLNQKLAPYTSPNQQTIGELFAGFLHYFAYIFKFNEEVMSVRLGRTISKELVIQQSNSADSHHTNVGYHWKYLCIEEPFNLSNTAYSVHDAFTFGRIRRVIQQSCDVLRQSGNVESIIKGSLVPF